jgi:hypothetical protein
MSSICHAGRTASIYLKTCFAILFGESNAVTENGILYHGFRLGDKMYMAFACELKTGDYLPEPLKIWRRTYE